MIRAFIYDFDGVLCDSVDIKTQAFASLYKKYGVEIQDKVVSYHLANGGISRFEKIRYYQAEFLGLNPSGEDILALAGLFANLVKEKVISCEYIPGALQFIRSNKELAFQAICTGTPQDEILDIAVGRGIDMFFDEILGSPLTKEEILNFILEEQGFSQKEVIFFGDAMTDYNAAKKCGVNFIGVASNRTIFPRETIVISDFLDSTLYEILKNEGFHH